MQNLSFYVWREFARDYTSGIACAVATSADEARAMILALAPPSYGYDLYWTEDLQADPEVLPLSEAACFCQGGG